MELMELMELITSWIDYREAALGAADFYRHLHLPLYFGTGRAA
jgi:hypothetical protein